MTVHKLEEVVGKSQVDLDLDSVTDQIVDKMKSGEIALADSESAETEIEEPELEETDSEEVGSDISEEEEGTPDDSLDENEPDREEVVRITGGDVKVELPDGTLISARELQEERMRQAEFTRKMQQLAREEDELARYRENLKKEFANLDKDRAFLQKLNQLQTNNPDFREELSSLLRTYGEAEAAQEVKKDPLVISMEKKIEEMTAALDEMKREKEQAEAERQARDAERMLAERVETLAKRRYPYADLREVKALLLSGEFDSVEAAVRYSHNRVAEIEKKKNRTGARQRGKSQPPPSVKSKSSGLPPEEKVELPRSINDPNFWEVASRVHRKLANI